MPNPRPNPFPGPRPFQKGEKLYGRSRETAKLLDLLIAERKFPSPVRFGPSAVAWRSSDLDEWSEARPVVSH